MKHPIKHPTVLVVDDNPTNLKLAFEVLSCEGFHVLKAENATQALAAIQRAQPELILMDLAMPGCDGSALTRKLKADPVTRNIPIVAWTAYAMKGDDQKSFEAGCDGYITKPIEILTFPAQVETYLRHARMQSARDVEDLDPNPEPGISVP